MIPILVDVVTAVLSWTLIGGSGKVTITAPLPASEKSDRPYAFDAATLAKIDEPHAFENGDALSAEEAI